MVCGHNPPTLRTAGQTVYRCNTALCAYVLRVVKTSQVMSSGLFYQVPSEKVDFPICDTGEIVLVT